MRYCYLNNNISGVVFAFLFLFFVFIVSHQCCYSIFLFFHSFVTVSFVPYTWNDLSYRRPAAGIDGVDLIPAAYHNRNVIFFSLYCFVVVFFFLDVRHSLWMNIVSCCSLLC